LYKFLASLQWLLNEKKFMKNLKNSIFYFVITGGFTAIMYWILMKGKSLEFGKNLPKPVLNPNHWNDFLDSITHNFQHPLAVLLAQITTIILTARLFSWLFRKIGQPSVIGEIIAGIVLGPSLLGYYFPETFTALFPVASLGNIQFLSQMAR
jgi:hypothetical protein